MNITDVLNLVLPFASVLVIIALIWFVIELVMMVRRTRSAVNDIHTKLKPTLEHVEHITAALEPVALKADPLMERVALTVDAANLEIMRLDQILEDVNEITGTISSAANAVDAAANAPIELVSNVTSRVRNALKPRRASSESIALGEKRAQDNAAEAAKEDQVDGSAPFPEERPLAPVEIPERTDYPAQQAVPPAGQAGMGGAEGTQGAVQGGQPSTVVNAQGVEERYFTYNTLPQIETENRAAASPIAAAVSPVVAGGAVAAQAPEPFDAEPDIVEARAAARKAAQDAQAAQAAAQAAARQAAAQNFADNAYGAPEATMAPQVAAVQNAAEGAQAAQVAAAAQKAAQDARDAQEAQAAAQAAAARKAAEDARAAQEAQAMAQAMAAQKAAQEAQAAAAQKAAQEAQAAAQAEAARKAAEEARAAQEAQAAAQAAAARKAAEDARAAQEAQVAAQAAAAHAAQMAKEAAEAQAAQEAAALRAAQMAKEAAEAQAAQEAAATQAAQRAAAVQAAQDAAVAQAIREAAVTQAANDAAFQGRHVAKENQPGETLDSSAQAPAPSPWPERITVPDISANQYYPTNADGANADNR